MNFSPRTFSRRIWLTAGFFLVGLVLCAAAPNGAAAATFITNSNIAANTTWTKAASPYVISGYARINAGVTLTVEPGTIIKFANNTFLGVSGNIIARGTAAEKIYFTSLLDDSLGGDTNGDGSSSFPHFNDYWGMNISSPSASSDFNYVDFSYSYGSMWFNYATASFDHVAFNYVVRGIGASNSNVSIHDAVFSNIGSSVIDAYNNSQFDIASATIRNVSDSADVFRFYDNSRIILEQVDIKNIGHGRVLNLQGSTAIIGNSIFDGGLSDGLYTSGSFIFPTSVLRPSTLSISTSTISNFINSGLLINGSSVSITNTRFNHNGTGIKYRSSQLSLLSNSISDNNLYGLYNDSLTALSVAGNYWGDPSGPYHSILNPAGIGNKVYGNVAFSPWLTEDPTKATKPDPVIIIPGLLGSAQKDSVWVIDPIFHVYDNLVDTLKANGYVEGKDLFTFPYDWRKSNVDSAILLRSKIAAVRAICQCPKVDLVAHSMGGLVARQYIESPTYRHDVDHLIFLGTPHLGAAEDYLTWEAGESAPNAIDQGLKYLLSKEAKKAGYSSLFNYIHDKPIPSFQELLPVTDYLHDKATTTLKVYPTGYPQNTFLESLNANVSALLNSGAIITNIVGDTGTSTITFIRVVPSTTLPLWQDGFPDGFNNSSGDKGFELGKGDGTVSLTSSQFVSNDLNALSSSHISLPTNAEKIIYKKLTRKDVTKVIDRFHFPNLKILFIKILSPADIVVVAPDGKRVGKDFATGNNLNEIEDAFYSGYTTDDEYVTIPNPQDGQYQVITQGTGNGGEYTIATGIFSDTVSAESSFSGQTLPNMITPINIIINASSSQPIEVRPVDVVPPVITVSSPQSKDYIRGDIIAIDATSTDSGSGLFSFGLSWNGRMVQNRDRIDSFFEKLGNQMFVATATDYVGNIASTSVLFRITATASSTIADVERAFKLGWITNRGIKEDIIEKLKQAIRLEKRIELLTEKLPGRPKIVKKIEKFEERLDKVLGKIIIKELDKKHPKFINDQAYNLLVEDINWLINN